MQGIKYLIVVIDVLIKKNKYFHSLTMLALCFSSLARAKATESEGSA